MFERVIAASIAALLVAAIPLTDQAGFTLGALFIVWNWWKTRKQ